MIKRIFRKPYARILESLTKQVLQKHNPTVIAVTGDGYTAIARELVYEVMKEKYAVRRSLESSEAEFSIPFTILGYNKYPKNILEWVIVLAKTVASLKHLKSYAHYLVLELNFVDTKMLSKWLEIIKPETLLIIGKIPVDYSVFNFKKVVRVNTVNSNDILGPFKIGIRQIARYYQIDDISIETVFENFSLPDSKIRYLKGINDSFIIDASFYTMATPIESVIELIDMENENVFVFTDSHEDIKFLKKIKKAILNPKNYIPGKNDTIILRGQRQSVLNRYQNILKQL